MNNFLFFAGERRQPYDRATFIFRQLLGNQQAAIRQMIKEIELVYEPLITRVERKPLSTNGLHRIPVLIGIPDIPVWKYNKQPLVDVHINEGLHFDAIILVPGKSWLRIRPENTLPG